MTPQDLKNSILQLAIQGKLVEQRPEEGVAEVPAAHKHGGKETRRHGEIEPPFDIPESWRWVRLGEVGSWGSGATPSRTKLEYYGGTIPWLKTGDLNDGYISDVPEKITELALAQTSVRMNPAGSVLMAMYGATIGKLGIITVPMTTNQACCACAPYEGIYNRYLFFFLLARRQAFIKMGEGGAQPNISKEKIVNSLFPLPPLAEQKRIVSKIEELLPLLARYEQAWTKLEAFNTRFPSDLQKSLLQLAIQGKLVEQRPEEGSAETLYRQIQSEKHRLVQSGKIKKEKPLPEITEDEIPFDIPASWKWVRWGDLSHSIQYGYNAPALEKGRIKMVRISDIQEGQVLWNTVPYCEIKEDDIPAYLLRPNDILFARTGGTVGKSFLVREVPEEAIYAGYLIRTRYSSLLCPEYMKFFMESQLYWNQLQSGTVATAQPNCNGKTLAKMILPLPPLAEQKRIVAKLEELLPLCERLK
jgi:type I restriction enzyme S subunit